MKSFPNRKTYKQQNAVRQNFFLRGRLQGDLATSPAECQTPFFFGNTQPLNSLTRTLNFIHTSSSLNSKCIVPFL